MNRLFTNLKVSTTFVQAPLPFRHHHVTHIQNRAPLKFERLHSTTLRRRCCSSPTASAFRNVSSNNSDEGNDSENNNQTEGGGGGRYEPVEDGVQLPSHVSEQELEEESSWLHTQIASWLDEEWPDSSSNDTHKELATRSSQLYSRLRAEGIHDVGTLLLGIGAGLEGMDFTRAYVGPWNVANKVSDLLLRRFAPERFENIEQQLEKEIKRNQNQPENSDAEPTWSILNEDNVEEIRQGDGRRRVASPSLADGFERYRFLQMVLDGSASKALIDGAVAVAMGFEYNQKDGTWNGESVTDSYFKEFGHVPPDVLGDENDPRWTKTLVYLDSQVKCSDSDGQKEEGLKVVIETLHGVELTEIQTNDENDHAFKKRLAVCKWLHLLGGF